MAVKARQRKKHEREARLKAVKIKCCFCEQSSTCRSRAIKEADENKGIITSCMITTNVITKKKKKKKNKHKKKSFFMQS